MSSATEGSAANAGGGFAGAGSGASACGLAALDHQPPVALGDAVAGAVELTGDSGTHRRCDVLPLGEERRELADLLARE